MSGRPPTRAHWWQRLRRHPGRPAAIAQPTEADVAPDPTLAGSRAVGGIDDDLTGDRGSTTGTGRTGIFVGRVAGDDVGYAGETGAERRSESDRHRSENRSTGPGADHG